jgi:hypothetical protein
VNNNRTANTRESKASNPALRGPPLSIAPFAMELWATGFNAWGQLNFDEIVPIESPDLPSFTLILEDGEIEVRALYEAATLGKLFELEYLLFCPDLRVPRGIAWLGVLWITWSSRDPLIILPLHVWPLISMNTLKIPFLKIHLPSGYVILPQSCRNETSTFTLSCGFLVDIPRLQTAWIRLFPTHYILMTFNAQTSPTTGKLYGLSVTMAQTVTPSYAANTLR